MRVRTQWAYERTIKKFWKAIKERNWRYLKKYWYLTLCIIYDYWYIKIFDKIDEWLGE